MAIIVAFFCGMCFLTLSDSIADWISACAARIEAIAHSIEIDNDERRNKQKEV